MLEINPPEISEFVLDPTHAKEPYYGLLKSLAESRCWDCKPLRIDWQDYNYFSGAVAYVSRQGGGEGGEAYEVLPKSLAVSLCRAYEKGATAEEALEVFGGVIWTLKGWIVC